MGRRPMLWWMLLVACDRETDEHGDAEPTNDLSGCVYTQAPLPDLEAVGPTGLTGAGLLAEAEGTYRGQITWDTEGPPHYLGSTEPSPLTLTLGYAGGEARRIDAELLDCPNLGGCFCNDRLEVDVSWTLRSDDGVLDERWTAVLVHEAESSTMARPIGARVELDLAATGGTLSPASFATSDGTLEGALVQATFGEGRVEGSVFTEIQLNEAIGVLPAALFSGEREG